MVQRNLSPCNRFHFSGFPELIPNPTYVTSPNETRKRRAKSVSRQNLPIQLWNFIFLWQKLTSTRSILLNWIIIITKNNFGNNLKQIFKYFTIKKKYYCKILYFMTNKHISRWKTQFNLNTKIPNSSRDLISYQIPTHKVNIRLI